MAIPFPNWAFYKEKQEAADDVGLSPAVYDKRGAL
jgi:hypothetical protein